MKPVVAILMGSDSDLPHLEGCMSALRELGVGFEVRVLSAHRTPEATHAFAREAPGRGIRVIVAAAGGAAHLAGALAANCTLPIIGIPIPSSALNGLDALLSTVMMPPGIPVATVGIGAMGASNAGILAAQMLSLGDPDLAGRLREHRSRMAKKVEEKDASVRSRFAADGTP